jgi:hypothetical protein
MMVIMQDSKKEKLAMALRANLKKRKMAKNVIPKNQDNTKDTDHGCDARYMDTHQRPKRDDNPLY